MPAQNITQDPIDDVGRAKTLIMPARLAQRQFGGPLDQCPLDGIEVFKPTQRLGELGGSATAMQSPQQSRRPPTDKRLQKRGEWEPLRQA
jgi:hypothetical protein